jgi:hypothetical protein
MTTAIDASAAKVSEKTTVGTLPDFNKRSPHVCDWNLPRGIQSDSQILAGTKCAHAYTASTSRSKSEPSHFDDVQPTHNKTSLPNRLSVNACFLGIEEAYRFPQRAGQPVNMHQAKRSWTSEISYQRRHIEQFARGHYTS